MTLGASSPWSHPSYAPNANYCFNSIDIGTVESPKTDKLRGKECVYHTCKS